MVVRNTQKVDVEQSEGSFHRELVELCFQKLGREVLQKAQISLEKFKMETQ